MKPLYLLYSTRGRKSHPAGVRGLKPAPGCELAHQLLAVAPRRGAWVETSYDSNFSGNQKVAPRRGAWVETDYLKGRPSAD